MNIYANPLDILIRAEEQTCKGCKHQELIYAFGEQCIVCAKNHRIGKRCNQYEEKVCQNSKG